MSYCNIRWEDTNTSDDNIWYPTWTWTCPYCGYNPCMCRWITPCPYKPKCFKEKDPCDTCPWRDSCANYKKEGVDK